MPKHYLTQTETLAVGDGLPWADVLANLAFNDAGLIPAIAQQYDSKEVLMMAWMNRTAIEQTLATRRVCYWSRSRRALWRKGESSGQVQWLKTLSLDCDGDTLLLAVDQHGSACHTGRRHCFYNMVAGDRVVVATAPLVDPETLYGS